LITNKKRGSVKIRDFHWSLFASKKRCKQMKRLIYLLMFFIIVLATGVSAKHYYLELSYSGGKLTSNDVLVKGGDVPSERYSPERGYTLEILSVGGQQLYSFRFALQPKMAFRIPYFENGGSIIIKDISGKKVIEHDVVKYAATCPDGECASYEDHGKCPQDCASGAMDGYCDGVSDNICDPDCKSSSDDADCSSKAIAKSGSGKKSSGLGKKILYPAIIIIAFIIVVAFISNFLVNRDMEVHAKHKQLHAYIHSQISKGHPVHRIRSTLVSSGWMSHIVDKACKNVLVARMRGSVSTGKGKFDEFRKKVKSKK